MPLLRALLLALALVAFAAPACAVTAIARSVADATVRVVEVREGKDLGHGAGVVISPRHILTALHVVGAPSLRVEFRDGTSRTAVMVWRSKAHDLAVIDLGLTGTAKPLALACRKPRYMEMVTAVGHGGSHRWTGVTGFVSRASIGKEGRFLVNMSILPGFSGGPVADARGRVLGILVSGYGVRQGGLTYIGGFATAVSSATFCAELMAAGYLSGRPVAGGPK